MVIRTCSTLRLDPSKLPVGKERKKCTRPSVTISIQKLTQLPMNNRAISPCFSLEYTYLSPPTTSPPSPCTVPSSLFYPPNISDCLSVDRADRWLTADFCCLPFGTPLILVDVY